MGRIFALVVVGGVMALAWTAGDKLSGDAIGMALGVVFGVMATIPATLLVLALGELRDDRPEITEQRALMEASYWRGVAAGQQQALGGRGEQRRDLATRG